MLHFFFLFWILCDCCRNLGKSKISFFYHLFFPIILTLEEVTVKNESFLFIFKFENSVSLIKIKVILLISVELNFIFLVYHLAILNLNIKNYLRYILTN